MDLVTQSGAKRRGELTYRLTVQDTSPSRTARTTAVPRNDSRCKAHLCNMLRQARCYRGQRVLTEGPMTAHSKASAATGFVIPAAELQAMARTQSPRTVVWQARWNGRTIYLKRTRGVSTWISRLRAWLFMLAARPLAHGLEPSARSPLVAGSVEAGRLLQMRELGFAVPEVLGVADGVIALADCGQPLQQHLHAMPDQAQREKMLAAVMDDLLMLHRAGLWHGGAQVRNHTVQDGRLYRLDFEQPYGGRLPTALLQVADVVMLVSSAIRYVGADVLRRLALRWLEAMRSEQILRAWARVMRLLLWLREFALMRVSRYEFRRIQVAADAFSGAWQDGAPGLPVRSTAVRWRWRTAACLLALALVSDNVYEFVLEYDDPPGMEVELLELEA
jgi:hypothetical protein